MPETIKLVGSTKSKRTKDKNGKNLFHFKINEGVLIYCNIVNQANSRVLNTTIPNKFFGQLLDISPKKHTFLKSFDHNFHMLDYVLLIKIVNR